MKQDVVDRFKNNKEDHCWQYEIRQQNLNLDLKEANLTETEYNLLRVEDFSFSYVDKQDKEQCEEIKKFIGVLVYLFIIKEANLMTVL